MAEDKNYLHISGQSVTLPIWVFGGITAALFSLLVYSFNTFSGRLEDNVSAFTGRLDEIQTTQKQISKNQEDIRLSLAELKGQVNRLEEQTQSNTENFNNLELRVFNLEVRSFGQVMKQKK
jgi:peptidoglycan hydrolase CwlO-like protein